MSRNIETQNNNRDICQLPVSQLSQAVSPGIPEALAVSINIEKIGVKMADMFANRNRTSGVITPDVKVWQNARIEAGYSFETIALSPYGTLPIVERVILSSISC